MMGNFEEQKPTQNQLKALDDALHKFLRSTRSPVVEFMDTESWGKPLAPANIFFRRFSAFAARFRKST